MRLAALLTAAAVALAGCTPPPPEVLDGPYFGEGFSDGCRTAEARRAAYDNRSFRNDALFNAQPSYAAGWRSGFAQCQPPQIDGVQPTIGGQVPPSGETQ